MPSTSTIAATPATGTVVIEAGTARTVSPEGKTASMAVPALVEKAFPTRVDTCGLILPTGCLLARSRGEWTILVHQAPPCVYSFRWVEDGSRIRYGPGTAYAQVRLALPYLITLAVFRGGVLTHANECFFRNAPITDENDSLCYPALLNCSRFAPQEGRPLSWICTQHLDVQPFASLPMNARIRTGFAALRRCLIETGFNESSEAHEGSSWFSESRKLDPRLASVRAWEQASDQSPLFVLDVPWLPTGHSLGQVIERIFQNQKAAARGVCSANDLARIIHNHAT